jgi:hypothetical protein
VRKLLLLLVALLICSGRAARTQESTIVFGNGVRVQSDEAIIHAKLLAEAYRVHLNLSKEEFAERFGEIKVAHNQTECPGPGCFLDFYEAFLQWSRMNNVADPSRTFWRAIIGLEPLQSVPWNIFLDSLQGIGEDILPDAVTTRHQQEHEELYRSTIQVDHRKLLVVAHSQGNYFVNTAYTSELLTDSDRESFGVLAVASPASTVAGGGPHITLQEDPIHLVPGALPPNITNGFIIPKVAHHAFYSSYVKGAVSGSKLMTLMDEALGSLRQPSSTVVRVLEQGQPGQPGKDIWTTSVFSYAPGGGGPGGGLDNEALVVGGFGDLYHALIEFDLVGLPQYASSARIELFCFRTRGTATTPLYLDRITEPWDWRIQGSGRDRERLWWADRPRTESWEPQILSAPRVGEWYSVDVTRLYNEWWQNGSRANYGIQLRPATLIGNEWSEFYSSNHPDPAFRPRLVIEP